MGPGPTLSLPPITDAIGNAVTISATENVTTQAMHTYKHEVYFTNQGCEERLTNLIKNTVLKQAWEAIYDDQTSFANVTTLKIMKHLKSYCIVTNI